MKLWDSLFPKPGVDSPPGVRQPLRLLAIRVVTAAIARLPRWMQARPRVVAFRTRLEKGRLWRTDILAWRVFQARQIGMVVGRNCRLYSLNVSSEAELVELGDNVIVSGEVRFVTHDGAIFTALEKFPQVNGSYGKIRIGNRCFIGLGAIIMPGVELGDNCIVAGGAVVTDSFSANSVVAGNPATYVCPTSMYLELKRHSPGTIYDERFPFPSKMPPDLLRAAMDNVAFRPPRRRDSQHGPAAPPLRALS